MMSKQTAISAAASVFAMASFALLAPQSKPLEKLADGTTDAVPMQVEIAAPEITETKLAF